MQVVVKPKRVATAMLWIVGVLTSINCVVIFLYFYWDDNEVFGLVEMFDFANEHNIPTFYSAVAILFCSALLALIAHGNWRKPGGNRTYWVGLSLLFLFLAVDEMVAIHEGVGDYFEVFLEAEGFLYFMWVVPYGLATILIAIIFLDFVWELPAEIRTLFIASGIIFVTGAIGLEMVGGREADANGTGTIFYCCLYTIEEVLEMLGIILFAYALLSYLTRETQRATLVLLPDGVVSCDAQN